MLWGIQNVHPREKCLLPRVIDSCAPRPSIPYYWKMTMRAGAPCPSASESCKHLGYVKSQRSQPTLMLSVWCLCMQTAHQVDAFRDWATLCMVKAKPGCCCCFVFARVGPDIFTFKCHAATSLLWFQGCITLRQGGAALGLGRFPVS